MKNERILLAGLLIIGLISCEKEKMDDYGQFKSKTKYLKVLSADAPSDNGISPVIINGANKGGNRTCEEVAAAFNTTFDLCGDKLNYSNFDADAESEFDGSFPEGLEVTVDGNYISFSIKGCLEIDGEFFKVGAVIVKGSNAANIYYYPTGTLADGGLIAPGGHLVSNLTFCYVKCDESDEIYIAVKSYLWFSFADGVASDHSYAGSFGPERPFNLSDGWCKDLGAYQFTGETSFKIYRAFVWAEAGSVSIVTKNNNLVVTVKVLDEMLLDKTDLFIGSLPDLKNSAGAGICPNTTMAPWRSLTTNGAEHIFTIPLSEI